MRSSEGLQRYKINERRALKGTDGPCFPAACNVCRSTSGFVCSTVTERLRRGHVLRIRLQMHPSPTSFHPWALCLVPACGGGVDGVLSCAPRQAFLVSAPLHPTWVWIWPWTASSVWVLSHPPSAHCSGDPSGILPGILTPQPLQRWDARRAASRINVVHCFGCLLTPLGP